MSRIDPEVLRPFLSQMIDQLEQVKASLDSLSRGIAGLISLAYTPGDEPSDESPSICLHPKMVEIHAMGSPRQWLCGDCGGHGFFES